MRFPRRSGFRSETSRVMANAARTNMHSSLKARYWSSTHRPVQILWQNANQRALALDLYVACSIRGWFGFNNQAHLDLLKVTMADEQRKPILTLTYPIDTNWKGRRECPKFRVECFPNTNSSVAPLACMVYPSGVLPGQELTYHWNVSNGSIASGQGTRRITVNLIGTEAETIKAELEIGNLPLTCERKASFTGSIRK